MQVPKPSLHRAGRKADWEGIPKNERTVWQRVAFGTKGILTPANVISVGGALLVFLGLYYLFTDELARGFICVAAGRFADVLDGVVAQITGTKSSMGEAVDAGLDKIIVMVAVVAFVVTGIVPLWAAVIVGLRNAGIVALGLLGKAHHVTLHPSRAGKYAAASEWAAVLLFMLAALFAGAGWGGAESAAALAASAFLAMAAALGIAAIKGYARNLTTIQGR